MARYRRFPYNSWPGGRNSAGLPSSIRADQLREALNYEYDSEDKLLTRTGYKTRMGATDTGFDTSKRITSGVHYRKINGTSFILITNHDQVFKVDPSTGDLDNINGLSLPDDTLWMWRTFPVGAAGAAGTTEACIGVNRADTASGKKNPIYVDDGSATKDWAALDATLATPKAKLMEIWNNRVFMVDADDPTKLRWSRTANGLDFKTSADPPTIAPGSQSIDAKDGEPITGLLNHRQRLYIFKRTKSYMVIPGTPNTDFSLWKFEPISPVIGCVGQFTIASLLNDIVFLSDYGLMSLSAVQQYGDVDAALLSRDIKELREYNHEIDSFYGIVHPENSQYWLAMPNLPTNSLNEEVHVLDFKRGVSAQLNRWTKFNGKVAGTCYFPIRESGRNRLWIGRTGEFGVQKIYGRDTDPFSDDGLGYDRYLQFRELSPSGSVLDELEFDQWGVSIKSLQGPVTIAIGKKFDGDLNKQSTENYTFLTERVGTIWADTDGVLESNELGSEGTYRNPDGTGGTAFFATEVPEDLDVVECFGQPEGRVGQTLELSLLCTAPSQGFALKGIMFTAEDTQHRDVGDV